jgi:hypothetical protein
LGAFAICVNLGLGLAECEDAGKNEKGECRFHLYSSCLQIWANHQSACLFRHLEQFLGTAVQESAVTYLEIAFEDKPVTRFIFKALWLRIILEECFCFFGFETHLQVLLSKYSSFAHFSTMPQSRYALDASVRLSFGSALAAEKGRMEIVANTASC